MARGWTVPLRVPAQDAVIDLALQEYRRPAEQAGWLIEEALRARGLLAPAGAEEPRGQPAAAGEHRP